MIVKWLLNLASVACLSLALLFCAEVAQNNSARTARDHETFIQGKWRLTGELPKDKSDRARIWFLEWTFGDGKFLQTGYPPIKQEGKYRIVKREDDELTLELYEQKGNFGTSDRHIEIVIDEKNERLKIMSQENFSRVENKK